MKLPTCEMLLFPNACLSCRFHDRGDLVSLQACLGFLLQALLACSAAFGYHSGRAFYF